MFPEAQGKVLPINMRHGLIRVVFAENRLFNLLPLVVGIGFIRFGLKLANQFPELTFSRFPDSLNQSFTRSKKIHHFIVLQSFGGFGERSGLQRPSRFKQTIDRYKHGAVFLNVTHVENLIPESLAHPFNVNQRDGQVLLRKFFDELNKGKHTCTHHPNPWLGFSLRRRRTPHA
jgi:hypothetical protein